jgi:NADH:ubiquinone oxidoreductase subunit E
LTHTQTAAKLKIAVCTGPSCSLLGSSELRDWCGQLEAAGLDIHHEITGCTGNCLESPVVEWNGRYITECSPEKLTSQLIEDGCL